MNPKTLNAPKKKTPLLGEMNGWGKYFYRGYVMIITSGLLVFYISSWAQNEKITHTTASEFENHRQNPAIHSQALSKKLNRDEFVEHVENENRVNEELTQEIRDLRREIREEFRQFRQEVREDLRQKKGG